MNFDFSSNLTTEEVKTIQRDIEKHLIIDKKQLSSAKRKRISAQDSRTSSQMIGWVGGLVLGLIVAFITISDVIETFRFCMEIFCKK